MTTKCKEGSSTHALSYGSSRPLWALTRILLEHPIRFAWISCAGVFNHGLRLVVFGVLAACIGRFGAGMTSVGSVYWVLVLGVIATAVASWWQLYVGHDWAFRLLKVLRLRVYDGIALSAPSRLGRQRTGDLATTARDDVDSAELYFIHIIADLFGAGLVACISAGVIAIWLPYLAIVSLLGGVAMAVIPFLLAHGGDRVAAQIRELHGTVNASLLDYLQGRREITLYRAADKYCHLLAVEDEEIAAKQCRAALRSALVKVVAGLSELVTLIVAIVLLVEGVNAGSLDLKFVPLLFVLCVASLTPLVDIAEVTSELGAIREAARRVLELMHASSPIKDRGQRTPTLSCPPSISFQQVSLDYKDRRGPALTDVSMNIAAGEIVALVGPSGAGKTSIVNLLQRFWDPTGGTITFDGERLDELSPTYVRSLVALVPQDIYLFEGTIHDNICLGCPGASMEQMKDAAQRASASSFIEALPNGYDTYCEPGGENLSGGQRQRVAIARAFITGAPVLLMDEAVSNLDGENEDSIAGVITEQSKSRTTVVIAHRLSTIRRADRVILLDGGRVLATGSHSELLKIDRYRELLATQVAAT